MRRVFRPLCMALGLVGILTWPLAAVNAAESARADAGEPALPRSMGEPQGQSLARWSDAWIFIGEDEPERVLQRLEEMSQATGPAGVVPSDWQQALLRTQGMVAARSGMTQELQRRTQALQALVSASEGGDAVLIRGDVALMWATYHDLLAQEAEAARFASEADRAYAEVCAAPHELPACDPGAWWRAVRLLTLSAERQGRLVDALDLAQRGRDLAQLAFDPAMEAWSRASEAYYLFSLGDVVRSRSSLQEADRRARDSGDRVAMMRVRYARARVASASNDVAAALRLTDEALALIVPLHSLRLESQLLPNLSDFLRRAGRPKDALAAVLRAYPVLLRHHDLRAQPMLLHNGGLARIQLGQVAQGRQDLERALKLLESSGAKAQIVGALGEGADALGAVGDDHGALELIHREEAMREEINRNNRDAMLAQLRANHQAEADRRELDLLERDNALNASRLKSQNLMGWIWMLGTALLVLAAGVVGLLVLRARDTTRRLQRSEAMLRVQSERDPLTGLANRRHFRQMLATMDGGDAFKGTLVLLDVDHFKRINDEYGHQSGDVVLVELAQRLVHSVRSKDLVCRWGGEEFLVYSPDLQGDALIVMAQRVLRSVGDRPVRLPDGRELAVTASIGYGTFPLGEAQIPLSWERAVNLVDMALYTAKATGRDRAAGILSVRADDARGLGVIERDFEHARLAGLVALRVDSRLGGDVEL